MNNSFKYFFIFFSIWFFTIGISLAQVEVRPLLRAEDQKKSQQNNLRTAEVKPMNLPFWEDFSTYEGEPHDSLWVESEHVWINTSMGINPPSLGVATLDGLNNAGRAYNSDPNEQGLADSLLSRPIDLLQVPEDKRGTVYISFFWQIKGRGEMPNDSEDDILQLQFKRSDGIWDDVWQSIDQGDYSTFAVDSFYQQIIQVAEPAYFHENFQFRFRSFGRLSGPYDTWNLDYIYLNDNRDAQDITYLDRAYAGQPGSLFNRYSAMPIDHFFVDPQKYLIGPTADIYNLDVALQPVGYSAQVFNTVNGDLIDVLNEEESFLIRSGQSRHTLTANPLNVSVLDTEVDSIYFTTRFYLQSGDRKKINKAETVPGDTVFYDAIDFRVNDTTESFNILHDFYAYDDGTAEFNAGISQAGGKLAYQFVIEKEDLLTAVQLYFPESSPSPFGKSLELNIWQTIDDNGEVLYRKQSIQVERTGPNQFQTVPISPVLVKDTIYIGWTQSASDFIGVGLDKNSNSADKMFFNTGGNWKQNSTVEGNLMIRPVFGDGEVVTSVTEKPARDHLQTIIYPNPGTGTFKVIGEVDRIKVSDVRGVEVPVKPSRGNSGTIEIDLTGKPSGIYIMHLYNKEKVYYEKVILK